MTWQGKCLAAVIAFVGTGMFSIFVGILSDGFREAMARKRQRQGVRGAEEDMEEVEKRETMLLRQLEARLAKHEEEMARKLELLQRSVQEQHVLLQRIATA